ncbi:MAG: hypothetical protein EOP50_00025 [Sphingobacteriales bacterium]|nr:MAG: hypothetical protein EOP50_00025 [Sphingobacteriales bacterium]
MKPTLKIMEQRFDDFPVRPEPLFGESLPGYLWRFLNCNGHDYSHSPFAANMVRRQQGMRQCLMRFFGHARLTPLYEAEAEQLELLKQFEKNAWLVNSHACRPCPACLRSTGVFMARQLLPLVSACLEHECWLLHRCQTCHGSLPWSHIKANWSCRCGASLIAAVTPQAPAWVIRLARWVQSGTGRWLSGVRHETGSGHGACPTPLPSFFPEPTRCFMATMNGALDQAFSSAIDHAPGETSARRLNRTMPYWRHPIDTSPHLLTREEVEVVRFVFEDTSTLAQPSGVGFRAVLP